MKRARVIALLISISLFMSCAGDTGPVGPAGPVGPVGPVGPQGPLGNANVQAFTVTIATADFTNSGSIEAASYFAALITPAVVGGGVVLAFTDLGTGLDVWLALPLTIAGVNMTYAYSLGSLNVFLFRPPAIPPIAAVFNGYRIRVVVIPPAQMARLAEIDKANYEALEGAFQLAGGLPAR